MLHPEMIFRKIENVSLKYNQNKNFSSYSLVTVLIEKRDL